MAPRSTPGRRTPLRVLKWGAAIAVLGPVAVLLGVSTWLYVRGESNSPFTFAADYVRWLGSGGPRQREFAGFEYEYETADEQGIVRYQIRLSVHEPEHPTVGIFEYRKERFRSQRHRDEEKADFVTWGTAELSDLEVQPIEKVVRAWQGGSTVAPIRGRGSAYPRLVFRGTTRVSGWAGALGEWSYESYEVAVAGGEVPAAVVDLLNSVAQALPPRVRSQYPLPIPPRVRSASR